MRHIGDPSFRFRVPAIVEEPHRCRICAAINQWTVLIEETHAWTR